MSLHVTRVCLVFTVLAGCASDLPPADSRLGPVDGDGFQTVYISANLGGLDAPTRAALRHLVRAADLGAELNEHMKQPGVMAPVGLDPAVRGDWFEAHPEAGNGNSRRTVVRAQGDGYVAIPYPQAFGPYLEPIAAELRAAARLVTDPRVARYLHAQADAYLSNEHREAYASWAKLDGTTSIDPWAGFGWNRQGKATPLAYIGIPVPEYQALTETLVRRHAEFDALLPRGPGFESWPLVEAHPNVIMDIIYYAPQDPLYEGFPVSDWENSPKPVKTVYFRNLTERWQYAIQRPVVEELLGESAATMLNDRTATLYIALHEVGHTVGPRESLKDGKEVPLRAAFEMPLPWVLDEAKSDVVAVLLFEKLVELEVLTRADATGFYVGWVGALFAQARDKEADIAHGAGSVYSLNALVKGGALVPKGSRFTLVPAAIPPVARDLAALYIRALRQADSAAAISVRDSRLLPSLEAIAARATSRNLPKDTLAEFDLKRQLAQ